MLERRGIISGYEGSKPRQVLISEADLPRILMHLAEGSGGTGAAPGRSELGGAEGVPGRSEVGGAEGVPGRSEVGGADSVTGRPEPGLEPPSAPDLDDDF
jgi:S-DNA-T family DNA segregation ATPase FtsK/SpoIIIE